MNIYFLMYKIYLICTRQTSVNELFFHMCSSPFHGLLVTLLQRCGHETSHILYPFLFLLICNHCFCVRHEPKNELTSWIAEPISAPSRRISHKFGCSRSERKLCVHWLHKCEKCSHQSVFVSSLLLFHKRIPLKLN